ncbi:MAG: DUF1418 family protein [Gammaproteobacteria bacterium]
MNNDRISIPVWMLILDIIGTVLVALGLYKSFTNNDLLPEYLRFGNDHLIFLLIGVALMVPFNVHMITQAGARAAARAKNRN